MKKLLLTLGTLFVLLLSFNALAGVTQGDLGGVGPGVATPNPDVQPNSKFRGRSLDAWVESYLRSWLEDAAIPAKNVAFLPIVGENGGSGNVFEVEVKPGTALVLPIALWLGFEGDPVLGPTKFFGDVTLDEQPIAVPNEDYYVGPTSVDPPIIGVITFYEGLAVVIRPLTPGEHRIDLYSTANTPAPPVGGGFQEFFNSWNITVVPPGKNK